MTYTEKSDDSKEHIEQILDEHFSDVVYLVEEDVVWVSGMNANCETVARQMADELTSYGIPTGTVWGDGATKFGGVEFNWYNPPKTQ